MQHVAEEILSPVKGAESLKNIAFTYNIDPTGIQQVDKWLSLPRRQNPYRTEDKIHTTAGGVKVRSKSEVIIGSFLEFKNIPYKYEEELVLDGNVTYPDFTIMRSSDTKILIWEHFGMMDDPGYAERNIHKRFLYEKNGFLPYDNFIATYSEGRGSLDMTQLERIVDAMLI